MEEYISWAYLQDFQEIIYRFNDFILKKNIKFEIVVGAWDEFRLCRSFGCDISSF